MKKMWNPVPDRRMMKKILREVLLQIPLSIIYQERTARIRRRLGLLPVPVFPAMVRTKHPALL
jgi:hypothetical protein